MSTSTDPSSVWPKTLPEITEEQQRIRDDFMGVWLDTMPNKWYGCIETFNHRYPLKFVKPNGRTLEIGAGLGAHLHVEDLDGQEEYVAMELRPELAERLREKFPAARVVTGDCQERYGFEDNYFDRVVAVHILEHLPDLPRALDEIHRVLKPGGVFSILIPCEGGMAYTLGRNLSARRIFEKKYKQSYDWFVACEHINLPHEIIPELRKRFELVHRRFYPFMLPIVTANLIIGLTLRKR